jgi:hypothetical protein
MHQNNLCYKMLNKYIKLIQMINKLKKLVFFLFKINIKLLFILDLALNHFLKMYLKL